MNRKQQLRTIALAAAGIVCITLVAWNRGPVYRQHDTVYYRDTVPAPARQKTIHDNAPARDFDEELKKLDEATIRLREHSADDWQKFGNDLQLELSKINLDEMQLNIETTLNNIDLKKINIDLKNAIASIDFDDIKVKLDKSIQDIDVNVDIKSDELHKALAEAKAEIKESLKEANKTTNAELKAALKEAGEEIKKADKESREEIRAAMDEARKEVKRSLSEIHINKAEMAEGMEKAKDDIEKARVEIKGYQDMVYDMEKQGLLSTGTDYEIRYAEGKLTINGKEQSEQTTGNYSKYFGKKIVVIKKKDGKLSVNKID